MAVLTSPIHPKYWPKQSERWVRDSAADPVEVIIDEVKNGRVHFHDDERRTGTALISAFVGEAKNYRKI